MQIPIPQAQQCQRPIVQPSYNAVKIDIHNPQVNAPNYSQNPIQIPTQAPNYTAPIYSYPESQVYEVPKQSIYTPQTPAVKQPSAVQEVPSVPPPVVIAQPTAPIATPSVSQAVAPSITPEIAPEIAPVAASAVTQIAAVAPEIVPAKTEEVKTTEATPTPEVTPAPVAETKAPEVTTTPAIEINTPEVAPQAIEVKTPEITAPKVDVNEFINKLTSSDYEVQATTMEAIADMAQSSPQTATELLDVKVIDTLLGIMNADSSKLTGPTPQQLQIREKIMGGKPVTEAETLEANKTTPMEQAERNKQYSIYTVAILQKLYGSEVEKLNKTVVPLTELPGAAGIVEQVKTNPNPMVRASALDALSFIQRPEYKQDLTTLFTVAQKDKDAIVQQIATKALEKLAKVSDTPVVSAAPEAPASAITSSTDAKPEEVKPEEKKAE